MKKNEVLGFTIAILVISMIGFSMRTPRVNSTQNVATSPGKKLVLNLGQVKKMDYRNHVVYSGITSEYSYTITIMYNNGYAGYSYPIGIPRYGVRIPNVLIVGTEYKITSISSTQIILEVIK